MLKKNIELDYTEAKTYEKIQEEVRIKKLKDRSIIFDDMHEEFMKKYNLDFFFFEENFFQKIVSEYRAINKKSIEYYNNTNREVSQTRLAMLRKYGYANDKEYKEAISYDRSKEILGLPSYLNPEKSLNVIIQKLAEPFYKFYCDIFTDKTLNIMKRDILEIKKGTLPLFNKDGVNRFEEILEDYQNLMYVFFETKLPVSDIIEFNKIAYGRFNYDSLKEALNDELEYRDEEILKISEKDEIKERFSKGRFVINKDLKRITRELKFEIEQNKAVIFDYKPAYNLDETLSKLLKFDEKKYSERVSVCQLIDEEFKNKNLFLKMLYLPVSMKARRIEDLMYLRYLDLDSKKINDDFEKATFKSVCAVKYEELCEAIENALVNTGVFIKYSYDMSGFVYNTHTLDVIKAKVRDRLLEKGLDERYYQEIEDDLIKEKLGPGFLEGYVDKISEINIED